MSKALSIRGVRKRNTPDMHVRHVQHYTAQWPKSERVRNTKRPINGTWYIANKNRQLSRLCLCGSARPVFALEHELVAQYFCAHCPTKPDDAVDIVSRRCKCMRTQPRYAMPDDARPLYCAACKPEGAGRPHATYNRTKTEMRHARTLCAKPPTDVTTDSDLNTDIIHTTVDPDMTVSCTDIIHTTVDPDMNYVEFS